MRQAYATPGPPRRAVAALAFVFVALHNLEEAFAFRAYMPQLPSLLPEPVASFASALNWPAMLLALAVVTLVAGCVAAAVVAWPASTRAAWALLTLEAVMAINALAHVASALFVFGGYAPGLVTAVACNAPFAAWCFRRARRECWVGTRALLATLPAALVLHGPVLAGGLWLASR